MPPGGVEKPLLTRTAHSFTWRVRPRQRPGLLKLAQPRSEGLRPGPETSPGHAGWSPVLGQGEAGRAGDGGEQSLKGQPGVPSTSQILGCSPGCALGNCNWHSPRVSSPHVHQDAPLGLRQPCGCAERLTTPFTGGESR